MIQEYINCQQIDQLRKKIIKTFKEIGFKNNIKTNFKIFGSIDMIFNLINCSYKSHKNSNDVLLYTNKISNHLRQIIEK